MSDLGQLRFLTEHVRPPTFASLQDTARRRDRQATLAALTGVVVMVLLVVGGLLTAQSDQRSLEPVEPDPDGTQTIVDADYGTESVHRFEAHQVSNTGSDADATDLSVSADFYEGSTLAYWCSGDPGVSYVVHVTGGTDDPDHVGAWTAGGSCAGGPPGDGDGYTGSGPPAGPTDSMGSQNMRFSPLPAEQGNPTTVRVVLTSEVPDVLAGCFDRPGGPIPARCRDATSVQPLQAAPGVDFGAVVFTRPVEYVATVAGVPVQAEASTGGSEWLFARGAESVPGAAEVTLEADEPGFVYVVQSDPRGRQDCRQAYEEAVARGTEFVFQGDLDTWGCTMAEDRLRLLVDGRPVAPADRFPGSGPFRGWFDFDAASLDGGHHEVTVERVSGDPRVDFGLVLFEETP